MMKMNAVLLKHLGVVLIISWLSVMVGQVVGDDPQQDDGYSIEESEPCYTWPWPDTASQVPEFDRQPIVKCPCQEGFVMLDSGNCYFISTQPKSWAAALLSCKSIGSSLASPRNVVQDLLLSDYLKKDGSGLTGYWLDGIYQARTNSWIWASDNTSMKYVNWEPNQPDGSPGYTERCVQYYNDKWMWNNRACDDPYPFVCQGM